MFFLAFASKAQQRDATEQTLDKPDLFNGGFDSTATDQWPNEIHQYTNSSAAAAAGTIGYVVEPSKTQVARTRV